MTSTKTPEYLAKMIEFLFADGTQAADWLRDRPARASEAIRHDGYPFGFAKNRWNHRERLGLRIGRRLRHASEAEKWDWVRAHEGVARALDLERLLGSFHRSGDDNFPAAKADMVADNVLRWLDDAGLCVVPKRQNSSDESLPVVTCTVPGIFDTHLQVIVFADAK